MLLEIHIDGRWAIRGSYPDGCKPEIQKHVYDAMEKNAKSWLDDGYRVRIDGIEINVPSPERMAATQETFEMLTLPNTKRRYETRKAA